MLPIDDADLASIALGTNPAFMDLIERSRARFREECEIPAEEMGRRVLAWAQRGPRSVPGAPLSATPPGRVPGGAEKGRAIAPADSRA